MLSAHVDQIILEGGRAKGVSLQGGSSVLASKAVVSNASLWDTQSLLPASAVTPQMLRNAAVSSLLFNSNLQNHNTFKHNTFVRLPQVFFLFGYQALQPLPLFIVAASTTTYACKAMSLLHSGLA